MWRHVLFDFDGTLVDSLGSLVKHYNRVAERRGYLPMSGDNIELMRTLGPKERVKFLGIRWYQMPTVARAIKQGWVQDLPHTACFSGIKELLTKLQQANLAVSVVSSNAAENIRTFSQQRELPPFAEIHSASVFGKHRTLRRYLRSHRLTENDVVYVGDEIRDAEACLRVGIRFVAVTWGADRKEAFSAWPHHAIVNEVSELERTLLSG